MTYGFTPTNFLYIWYRSSHVNLPHMKMLKIKHDKGTLVLRIFKNSIINEHVSHTQGFWDDLTHIISSCLVD